MEDILMVIFGKYNLTQSTLWLQKFALKSPPILALGSNLKSRNFSSGAGADQAPQVQFCEYISLSIILLDQSTCKPL